jgi:hypothetical protein
MPAAVIFPVLRPSNRTFTKGLYPINRQTFPAGTGTSRRFGTRPTDIRISLEFANITDAQAASIAAAYDEASGSYNRISLPNQFWEGISNELKNQLNYNRPLAGYYWRFAQPPVYSKSSIPGYKTVTVEFTGDISAPEELFNAMI